MDTPDSLLTLQRQMADYLNTGSAPMLLPNLSPNAMPPSAARLQVYRNNYRISLGEALATLYPAIVRLVGEQYFQQVAYAYLAAYPSRAGNLHDFGDQLPDFLPTCPGLEAHPYISDVARVDFAMHRAYHAAEGECTAQSVFAEGIPRNIGDIRFTLHPSATLLSSDYPVFYIWQAQQDDAPEQQVDLNAGAQNLLVWRTGSRVEAALLRPAEYTFLSRLDNGQNLEEATVGAFDLDPEFALQSVLSTMLHQGLIDGHSLRNT